MSEASSMDCRVGGWRATMWRIFGRHQWEYRNPYDRSCKTCGRNEVAHSWAGHPEHQWWEVFRDGDQHKHYESPNVGGNRLAPTQEQR